MKWDQVGQVGHGISTALNVLSDRVGGRTLTVELKTANGTDLWDLGGQWVGR